MSVQESERHRNYSDTQKYFGVNKAILDEWEKNGQIKTKINKTDQKIFDVLSYIDKKILHERQQKLLIKIAEVKESVEKETVDMKLHYLFLNGNDHPRIIRRMKISYCRITNKEDSHDQKTQLSILFKHFPQNMILNDIGDGSNFERPGFLELMKFVFENKVSEIAVVNRNHLLTIGFDLMKEWCEIFYDTKIIVLDDKPEDKID